MKINNQYDIRSGADSDFRGNVYVDRRIPQYSPKVTDARGLPANLWSLLATHETTEADAMRRGMPYDKAHKIATNAEKLVAMHNGIDWGRYTEEIDGYLDKIEKEKVLRPPPQGLHIDPNKALGKNCHHSKRK